MPAATAAGNKDATMLAPGPEWTPEMNKPGRGGHSHQRGTEGVGDSTIFPFRVPGPVLPVLWPWDPLPTPPGGFR